MRIWLPPDELLPKEITIAIPRVHAGDDMKFDPRRDWDSWISDTSDGGWKVVPNESRKLVQHNHRSSLVAFNKISCTLYVEQSTELAHQLEIYNAVLEHSTYLNNVKKMFEIPKEYIQ